MECSLTKLVILLALDLKKVCSADELARITGRSKSYIINVLTNLRSEGAIKSIRYNKFVFQLLNVPDQNPINQKVKFYILAKPLGELIDEQKIPEYLGTQDLNELRQRFKKFLEREGLLLAPY